MGLLNKVFKSFQKEADASQSPALLGKDIEGETVAVQKVYKLICDSINGNYFDIESAGIISGIIGRLKYPLADKAMSDLYNVLSPIYKRNYDAGTDDRTDVARAKDACLKFVHTVETRPNDGLGPYVAKGFSVSGRFLYGTQKEVIHRIESLGCTKVENNYSVNYSDYIFIGCKPSKNHPSEDFSDVVLDYTEDMSEFNDFKRVVIAEYDFEPLKG